MKRLDLAIDSDLGNVSLLAVAVNRVCLQLGLDDLTAGHVELCVAEAVTNSICHAYHGMQGHSVELMLSADAGELRIEVADRGAPMPADQQQRLARTNKDADFPAMDRRSLPEGGRGLQIIRDLMDQVSYISEGKQNRLIMSKKLASAEAIH